MTHPARAAVVVLALLAGAPVLAKAQDITVSRAEPLRLSPEEQAQFLVSAKLVSVRPVRKGITGTRRATLTDGVVTHDVHIQIVDEARATYETRNGIELDFKDSYRYNVAAYRLAVLLGLDNVPVSVIRTFNGGPAAYTWWVDEVMFDEGGRLKARTTGPDAQRFVNFVQIQRVFDEIIENTDRNTGNSLWSRDWTMWLVDHTRAFRTGNRLRKAARIDRVERDMLAAMRGLTAGTLTAAMGDSLTVREIEPLATRIQLLVAHFDRKIAERGEARVVFEKR